MARFFHVVGEVGVGKSMLIVALAQQFQAGGRLRCAGQHPEIFTSRAEAERERPGADVYFVEHESEETLDAQPGDTVIRMERTR